MTSKSAYMRRSAALLEWIEANRPDALVTCDGAELGPWRALSPRWQLENDRIRLQLHRDGRPMVFWAKCLRPTPWGARIPLAGRFGVDPELLICWEKAENNPLPSSSRLELILKWARSQWPGCRIESTGRNPDRTHTLSGAYFRIRIRWGAQDLLVLACAKDDVDESVHSILTQGLLWMSCLFRKKQIRGVPGIHLLVPANHSAVLCHRSRLINPERAGISVWECESCDSERIQVHQPAAMPAPVEDRDYRWPVLGPFRWSPLLARVLDLAPEAIQRYPRFQDYDSLRLHGLEFARVLGTERDRICFGVGGRQAELTEENFDELRRLVSEILYYRRADCPATDHPYFRIQAERWLECLLLNDVDVLFPELIPGSAYPQIPVYLGKIPGRADILGSDLAGNLVVMELKVSEDPDMPLQSLDYWGRVSVHNSNGDFERRGYFAGIRLSRARPKLYLVAPIFTFHDSLESLLRCLDANVEVTKIAINEDWRCGVKILRRSAFRCGDFQ